MSGSCTRNHLRPAPDDTHLETWFHVQDANDVAVTLNGTRLGDSLADLLFSILLSPVLAEVQELEASLGLAFGFSKRDDPLFAKQGDPQEALVDASALQKAGYDCSNNATVLEKQGTTAKTTPP